MNEASRCSAGATDGISDWEVVRTSDALAGPSRLRSRRRVGALNDSTSAVTEPETRATDKNTARSVNENSNAIASLSVFDLNDFANNHGAHHLQHECDYQQLLTERIREKRLHVPRADDHEDRRQRRR